MPKVVIVGCGLWGMSTALFLSEALDNDFDFQILEQASSIGYGASFYASGMIGHLQSDPQTLEAILETLDFIRYLNNKYGVDLQQVGGCLLSTTQEGWEAINKKISTLEKYNIPCDPLPIGEVKEKLPFLNTRELMGGCFSPRDAVVSPEDVCKALFQEVHNIPSVSFSFSTTFLDYERSSNRSYTVKTSRGILDADIIIFTTSAWTELYIAMPVEPPVFSHQVHIFPPISSLQGSQLVLRFVEDRCFLRPWGHNYLIGYYENNPTRYTSSKVSSLCGRPYTKEDVQQNVAKVMGKYILDLPDLSPIAERKGFTTFTPDGKWIIEKLFADDHIYYATGCSAMGLTTSAFVGKELARMIKQENEDDKYSSSRFQFQSRSELIDKSSALYSNIYR